MVISTSGRATQTTSIGFAVAATGGMNTRNGVNRGLLRSNGRDQRDTSEMVLASCDALAAHIDTERSAHRVNAVAARCLIATVQVMICATGATRVYRNMRWGD